MTGVIVMVSCRCIATGALNCVFHFNPACKVFIAHHRLTGQVHRVLEYCPCSYSTWYVFSCKLHVVHVCWWWWCNQQCVYVSSSAATFWWPANCLFLSFPPSFPQLYILDIQCTWQPDVSPSDVSLWPTIEKLCACITLLYVPLHYIHALVQNNEKCPMQYCIFKLNVIYSSDKLLWDIVMCLHFLEVYHRLCTVFSCPPSALVPYCGKFCTRNKFNCSIPGKRKRLTWLEGVVSCLCFCKVLSPWNVWSMRRKTLSDATAVANACIPSEKKPAQCARGCAAAAQKHLAGTIVTLGQRYTSCSYTGLRLRDQTLRKRQLRLPG